MTQSHAPAIEAFASRLLVQAAWPSTLAALPLAVAPTFPAGGAWAKAALVAACLFALATLVLSVLLTFDAVLFRVIASYGDETRGCAAVDDLLARMRLKPAPPRIRGFAERAAGTNRLLVRQRLALGLSAAACGLALAASRL